MQPGTGNWIYQAANHLRFARNHADFTKCIIFLIHHLKHLASSRLHPCSLSTASLAFPFSNASMVLSRSPQSFFCLSLYFIHTLVLRTHPLQHRLNLRQQHTKRIWLLLYGRKAYRFLLNVELHRYTSSIASASGNRNTPFILSCRNISPIDQNIISCRFIRCLF